MFKAALFIVPALMLMSFDSSIPGAVEVRRGVYVLQGLPSAAVCEAMRRQRITHVVDLRRDGEPDLDCQAEASRMMDMDVRYLRYAIGKVMPAEDFDFLRAFLRDLPARSQVVLHCNNGNRAAAVVVPWLVLDRGMPLEEALRLAHEAGLRLPETEAAVRNYVLPRRKG